MNRAEMEAVCGIVFDVQRMSLHDGPGMRTNVFLKGCPLRCGWCANPESQLPQPQLTLHVANCIQCGLFAQPCTACWSAAVQHEGVPARTRRADSTGEAEVEPACAPSSRPAAQQPANRVGWTEIETAARVDLCPTGALHWVGRRRTAGEIMAEVRRDRPFYGREGGLTLTGGEPTMQPDLCEALLWLAQQDGIPTAMETCGHTQWSVYARLLPWLNIVLYDVKHIDPEVHRQHTGFDNALILDNLARLAAAGASVRVRVPLVPGFNATPTTVAAIAEHVRRLPGPVVGIDLLPYHTLGKAKYNALGRVYPWEGHTRLSEAEVGACAAAVRAQNLPVTIGG